MKSELAEGLKIIIAFVHSTFTCLNEELMMYTMSHPDHDRPKRNITNKMSSAGPNIKVTKTSKNYDWKKNSSFLFFVFFNLEIVVNFK